MLIALRFNLSVDYHIELPQNKAKTSTAASSKAEASSSFKGFGFFKTNLAGDLIVEGLATSNSVFYKYVPTSSERTCENTTNGASNGRLQSDAEVSKQDHQRTVYSESR